MPRALTESERAAVEERLLTRGRDRFVRYGLAKTTVEALASDAGIGKGSFYQFFPSKEALFMAISRREEQTFRDMLIAELDAIAEPREAMMALLRAPMTRLVAHPFLNLLLDPATIAALSLRLPPEELQANEDGDRELFVGLAQDWIAKGRIRADIEPEEVFHGLSGMFLIALQRELLGPDAAKGAMDTIATALCDRWCSVCGAGRLRHGTCFARGHETADRKRHCLRCRTRTSRGVWERLGGGGRKRRRRHHHHEQLQRCELDGHQWERAGHIVLDRGRRRGLDLDLQRGWRCELVGGDVLGGRGRLDR